MLANIQTPRRPLVVICFVVLTGFQALLSNASGATPGASSLAVREALRNRLEQAGLPASLSVGDERILAAETTARFYELRAFEPAWFSGRGPSRHATDLLAALDRASDDGLDPSHYHAALIAERLQALRKAHPSGRVVQPGEVVDLELLLTDGFALFASHLLAGHVNPESIDPEWFAARRGGDMAAVLDRALSDGGISNALTALAPPQPGYGHLKQALARYRQCNDWDPVDEGPALRKGDRGGRVEALRTRLEATGDLGPGDSESGDREFFDDVLASAVRRFQERHGADIDGVVGKETLAALNRSREQRIRQIVVNLERWRWLPQSLGERHVLVNIAGFDVQAVKDGDAVLSMRAIVGKTFRRTPVFSDRISYLVLNPSWTIPQSIAVGDKLPLIRKDPSYLARQNIRVFEGWGADSRELDPASIDWSAVSARNFSYRLRQEPGDLNALGTMKFMFPNTHNVYLHDTPTKDLFAKSTRDFSSGCIRIEKPLALAAFLLESAEGWSADRIRTVLATKQEQTVRLPNPVPVHIQYWTAWVDEHGVVNFRRDLYARDEKVDTALRQAPPAQQN